MLKILFVSSGNLKLKKNPIVINQANSLIKYQEVKVSHYFIKGKGIKGYLKNITKLSKTINEVNPDVVHAHYSFSSMIAAISSRKPLVVSLMGSDVNKAALFRIAIRFFSSFFWSHTIVKSDRMKELLGLPFASVIPNGVDFTVFNEMEIEEARLKVGFDSKLKNILFIGDPKRYEKNCNLAEEAVNLVKKDIKCKLNVVFDTANNLIPYYLNAADLLLMTSIWEGSPNVIKEAMACNLPIISTEVGDVKQTIGNCCGCYITSYDKNDIAKYIKISLSENSRTKGREHIKHLSSQKIAKKIKKIYLETLNK